MKKGGENYRAFLRYNSFLEISARKLSGVLLVVILLLVSAIFTPFFASAAFNQQINYQGKLTDAADEAVDDGSYSIVFSLYTDSTDGTAIWSETRNVTVTTGLFSVMLGSINSLANVDFNRTLYLGVKVGADEEMTPRKIIGAVPAAFEAKRLEGLGAADFARLGFVNSSSTAGSLFTVNQTGTGSLMDLQKNGATLVTVNSNGRLGVGTASPLALLDVLFGVNDTARFSRSSTQYLEFFSDSVKNEIRSVSPIGSAKSFRLNAVNGASLALQTNSTNRLVIASSGDISISGSITSGNWNGTAIAPIYGGTGLSTAPTYGQLLLGNATGGYDLVSTSTLGLLAQNIISELTTNYLPRWNGSTFVDSQIQDDGTTVTIGEGVTVENIYGETWTAKDSSQSWSNIIMSADGSRQTATVSYGQIYISSDYGNTWTAKESDRSWSDIVMSDNGAYQTAVVSLFGGRIYVSNDYGATWATKGNSGAWNNIAMSADGSRQTATNNGNQIYISSDYGNTWTAKGGSQAWRDVAMSEDGQYQTAVAYNGQIYISSDYGNTWTAKESDRSWSDIVMSDNGAYQTAIIDGTDQIYVSADYGNTWEAKGSPGSWQNISISTSGQYQTVNGNNATIYVSTDYGNTWAAKESLMSWRDVDISNDGSIQTAVVNNGRIYVSTDYGNTWAAKSSERGWNGVAVSDDGSVQTAIVAGGQIYVSNAESNVTARDITADNSLTGGALSIGGVSVLSGTTTIQGNTTLGGTLTLPNSSILTGDTNYLRSSRGLAFGSTETYNFNSQGVGNIAGLTVSTTTSDVLLTGSVSQVSTSGASSPRNIAVCGNYGYAVNQAQNSLVVLDLTNKAAPTAVGQVTTNLSTPYGVACSGDYAYVSS